MARRRREEEEEEEEGEGGGETFSEEEEEEERRRGKRRKRKKKRGNMFIDDYAEEGSEDDSEEEETRSSRKTKPRSQEDSNEEDSESEDSEEEEEDIDDGFIVHGDEEEVVEEDDENGGEQTAFRPLPHEEEVEDVEALAKFYEEKYRGRVSDNDDVVDSDEEDEYDETTQQALLPSVRDPKLWMVKCAIGHEREVALYLLQKCMNSELPVIKSAIALDHLKGYVYIEADKEAHVKQACKGLRSIFQSVKPMLVPIKEMTDVVTVRKKAGYGDGDFLALDAWVRMKIGIYKGDIARVVEVNDVMKKLTVKIVPRIDLQAMADKLDGLEVVNKKVGPPQRLMNIREAKDLGIPTNKKRDRQSGEYFETVGAMKFKDGFLLKTVSMRSISTQGVMPTLDELERFWLPKKDNEGNAGLEDLDDAGNGKTQFSKGLIELDYEAIEGLIGNREKTQFSKGNKVIVTGGDLVNLMGTVERVDEDTVYVAPNTEDLSDKPIAINAKYLSKYFKPGDHVKVVSGEREGETGLVVMVEGRTLRIVSDATKEDVQVFAEHVVGSSEVTSGVPRVGEYELHDLVLLDNGFGVILRVESGALQVLKGNTEKPEVAVVRLSDIKTKLDRRISAQDRHRNKVSAKDIVTILEGPCKGRQGTVEHIYRGVLFISDRSYLEHSGFICIKAQCCTVLGGAGSKGQTMARYPTQRTASQIPTNNGKPPRGGGSDFRGKHMAGARGRDSLIGSRIKIGGGHYKGLRGIVKEAHGKSVRVELESQMKVVAVDRDHISDKVAVSSQQGSQTPIHSARTPLRPYMTPLRDDPRATPVHDAMRTPMHDRAWDPGYHPMTPARDDMEEDDGARRTSPLYQPGTPLCQPGIPLYRSPAYRRTHTHQSPAYKRTPPHQSPAYKRTPPHQSQPFTVGSPAYRRTPTHESSHLSPRTLTVGSQ